MAVSSVLLATFLSLAPQGPEGSAAQPILAPAEQKSLRDKALKLIETRTAYDLAPEKARDKANRDYQKAKEAFQKEWEGRIEKKGNLLKSLPDLQAIFANSFTYERRSGTDMIKKEDAKPKDGLPEYSVMVPKAYKNDVPMRSLLVVPGRVSEKDGWVEGRDHYAQTWDGSASSKDSIFHVAQIDKTIALDDLPVAGREGEEEKEVARIGSLLLGFGETKRNFNLDRGRVFLDCGKESSAFGLRLATHFPDLFAGVILRWPVFQEDLRLGSIAGLPVLLVATAETKDAAAKLKDSLDKLQAGSCTVMDATGAYPFRDGTAEIEKWMADKQRRLMRPQIVVEPNDDRFKKAFWAVIGRMDPLAALPRDMRPRLEVSADRATNRITVKSRGIENFALWLNDSLVDLDKEYTVVVNDKAFTQKSTRDFGRMFDQMLVKFDGDFLFPVLFECNVPAETKAPATGGEGKQ